MFFSSVCVYEFKLQGRVTGFKWKQALVCSLISRKTMYEGVPRDPNCDCLWCSHVMRISLNEITQNEYGPCASEHIHHIRKIALWTLCSLLRIKMGDWGKERLPKASKDKRRRERNRILRGSVRRSYKFLLQTKWLFSWMQASSMNQQRGIVTSKLQAGFLDLRFCVRVSLWP